MAFFSRRLDDVRQGRHLENVNLRALKPNSGIEPVALATAELQHPTSATPKAVDEIVRVACAEAKP